MADFLHRLPDNAPGRFYVDDQCLDCDLCRELAPNNFTRNDQRGESHVFRQPTTAEEVALCLEAVAGCCVEAIGADGDQHDWSVPTLARPNPPSKGAHHRCCHNEHQSDDTSMA